MPVLHKVFLAISSAALVFGDIWVVANTVPGVLSWPKISLAVLMQVLLLAGLALHLTDRRTAGDEFQSESEMRRDRATPLIIFILVSGLSWSLLYNGIRCGDHSLPTSRGAPICGGR
jgi:hypothetical protein